MPEPSEHEIEVFNMALELPAAERAAYLDRECAGDPALRRRLEELLKANEESCACLEGLAAVPPGPGGTVRASLVPAEKPGDRIGRYKLLQQIGEGGCGVVYMAEQEEPVRRRVALKVIKLGMDTKSVIARFEAERQALALMDHPNIAKVLDAGATETGRPYFVMELVRGVKITDYCDQNNLSTVTRLELFVQVCQAIQHAHQKGIIHRDIKPSNVLVADHDGVPVPKIIDFGIAKATTGQPLTDKTLFTAFEQFMGTPAYMSPEQATLSGLDIDTRSDIYSLGALLYELLTGNTPFEANRLFKSGLDEIRRVIREEEPRRPSTRLQTLKAAEQTMVAGRRQCEPQKLFGIIRGDLDWIVMKALEKDRARRYETANGLAMDVQRYLKDDPIVAHPPGNFYRLQKLARRHKLAFFAAGAVTAALVIGLGVATVALVRIQRADRQIRQAKDEATEKLRASYMAEARALRTSGQQGQRFASLDAIRNAAAIRGDMALRNEAIASLTVSDLRVAKEVILKGQGHIANELVRFDLNLEKYAVGDADGNISIRAVTNDALSAVLPAPGFSMRTLRQFSPDSRYLRATYQGANEHYSDWVWDLKRQTPLLKELPCGRPTGGRGDLIGDLAGDFSSDSRLFTRCQMDGTLSIYELESGKEIKRLPGPRLFNLLILNPAGTRLACCSQAGPTVEIRDVESGRMTATLTCPAEATFVAWSPDGRRLATGCYDYSIYIWDVETGQRQAALEGPNGAIISLAFNHAGNVLASGSFDGVTRLWEPDSGRQLASHPGSSSELQFSADDRRLLGWWNLAHFGSLEVADSREFHLLYTPRVGRFGGGISCPEFSADGRILVVSTGKQIRFWDTFSGEQIASFAREQCETHIFQPDGRGLILMDWFRGAHRRALEQSGGPTSSAYRLGKPQPLFNRAGLYDGTLSFSGRYFAFTREAEDESVVLDLNDPSAKPVVLRPDPMVDRIALSPDGHWAATSSWHTSLLKIWDAYSGALVRTLAMPARTLATFSPDGHWLATSTVEYQLWEVGSWRPKGPPKPGCGIPEWSFTAFSPDSQVMARDRDGTKVELFETLTEKPLGTLEAPGSTGIGRFKFSPDGNHLAILQLDRQVQLWDLRLIRQDLKEMRLDWDMPPLAAKPMADTRPVTLEIESDADSQADAANGGVTNK